MDTLLTLIEQYYKVFAEHFADDQEINVYFHTLKNKWTTAYADIITTKRRIRS